MFVKPKDGAEVRDPITKKKLPRAGKEVPLSTYWVRRLESGDVVPASTAVVQADQIPDSPSEE